MIAIAGGGIGGLTLAAALQQQGYEVVVLERQPEVRDAGAGISLWPNALAALDCVGLGELVRSTGRQIASGGLRTPDGRTALRFSARSFEAALGEGLVCVHRGELVAALAAQLDAGTVRTGQAVEGYELSGAKVRVSIAGGGTLEADALVGADGINSAVAAQMAGPLRFTYSGYTAWRGIADIDADPEGEGIWACLTGGHEIGWIPITRGRTYWFATACLPEGHGYPDRGRDYLAGLFAGVAHPVPALLQATPEEQLVRNDIVDRDMPARWTDGPVTIVGDAAHPMRPHQGQGGCQAIEDAAALARCLRGGAGPAGGVAPAGGSGLGSAGVRAPAGGPGLAEAFLRYERLRRPRAARVVSLSRRSGFTRPRGRATSVWDRLSSRLPSVPLGPAVRALAPVAGYRAGVRGVRGVRPPE